MSNFADDATPAPDATSYSTQVQYRRAPAKNSTAVIAKAPGIFQRSMQWRNKRDAKINDLRAQKVEREGPASLDFNSNYKDATVGEHLDAYHRYSMLVGEADGGVALPEAQYRKLEKRCAEAAKDRLFCTWRNIETKMDCVNVGPMTRCFCGHSYRAHAFYRNQSKKVHCRVPNCKCSCYNYVYHRGGRAVKCNCKHELELHRDASNRSVPCKHPKGCNCTCYVPTVTCTCEQSATSHETVFERRTEREQDGRLTQALWEEMEQTGGQTKGQSNHAGAGRDLARANRAMAAGVGGMTSYLSLVSGTERVLVAPSSALPADVITDANYMNSNGQTLQDMQGQMHQMSLAYEENALGDRMSYQQDALDQEQQEQQEQQQHGQQQQQYRTEGPPPQQEMAPHHLEEQLQYLEEQQPSEMEASGNYLEQEEFHMQQQQQLSPLSKHVQQNAHKQTREKQQQQQQQQQQWQQPREKEMQQQRSQHQQKRQQRRTKQGDVMKRGQQIRQQQQQQQKHQEKQRRARPRPVPKRTGNSTGNSIGKRYQQRTVTKVTQPLPRRSGTPPQHEFQNRRKLPANGRTQNGGAERKSKKPLPSYMRSTKAMDMWKTQTEEVRKKPKHLRAKEIY